MKSIDKSEAAKEKRREYYRIIVGGILFYSISIILITYGALYAQAAV